MPIIYAVVSRGATGLAKYAACVRNFAEVTEQILGKIGTDSGRLTYSHGRFLFHYIAENGLIYLCVSDDDFERAKTFAFLTDMKRRFQLTYDHRVQTAVPYTINSDFSVVLASQMRGFNKKEPFPDKMSQIQNQVEDVMVKDIGMLCYVDMFQIRLWNDMVLTHTFGADKKLAAVSRYIQSNLTNGDYPLQ